MPKKKLRSPASASRKRAIALDDLHKAVRTFTHQTANLTALLHAMESHGIKEIEIDGCGLLDRGVDEIDRFIDNVDKGLSKVRRDKERARL